MSLRILVPFVTAVVAVAAWAVLASGMLERGLQEDVVGAAWSETQASGRPPVVASGVPGERLDVDPAWVARTASLTSIPETAVAAYARASLGAPDDCQLGWSTLAGIGWVESQHGTIDGRILLPSGHSDEPVLGPALNGEGPVAAIRATERSTPLHGNPVWDHAVGPMQFIPSTWERFATDGDGDGVADPNDIDDAAAAAAAYLCHDRHDLTTSAGWNAAIFSYNHDNRYVVQVHAAADRYGRLVAG